MAPQDARSLPTAGERGTISSCWWAPSITCLQRQRTPTAPASRVVPGTLAPEQVAAVHATVLRAYRWQNILSGATTIALTHPPRNGHRAAGDRASPNARAHRRIRATLTLSCIAASPSLHECPSFSGYATRTQPGPISSSRAAVREHTVALLLWLCAAWAVAATRTRPGASVSGDTLPLVLMHSVLREQVGVFIFGAGGRRLWPRLV